MRDSVRAGAIRKYLDPGTGASRDGNANFGNYRRRNVFTEVPNLKASWGIRPESMK